MIKFLNGQYEEYKKLPKREQKLILICLILLACLLRATTPAHAKARYVTCPQKYPALIKVPLGDAMVMEFPEKPKHSLPGKNDFDFQYIDKDIGIKSMRAGTKANLFVYLGKRRCAFKLISSTSGSDDIVVVKYPKEETIEAKYVR